MKWQIPDVQTDASVTGMYLELKGKNHNGRVILIYEGKV
jgi:hypothetical protein